MLSTVWRPWGDLRWLLSRLPVEVWDFLGCIAPEERSLAAWEMLKRSRKLGRYRFLEIIDPPSRFSRTSEDRRDQIRDNFEFLGGNLGSIRREQLFARTDRLLAFIESFISATDGNIVLDISALPKRFFFPFLKVMLVDIRVKNLSVTYTVAERYGTGPLAEDPEPWGHLPLFAPSYPLRDTEVVVVSVGFQALNLPPLGDQQYESAEFQLLVPVTGFTPDHHRIWEFLYSFDKDLGHNVASVKWVDWKDISELFAHLQILTENGERGSVLAPYGPKPISLAMLLFSRLSGAGVYYTQPKAYNAEYSVDVRNVDGFPEVYLYPLKVDGEELYSFS